MIEYENIQKKGYLVINNFFSNEDIANYYQDYLSTSVIANTRYTQKGVSRSLINQIRSKLFPLLNSVALNNSLKTNCIDNKAVYFATDQNNYHPWHQDALTYYQFQSHKDFLIIWFPIFKETPTGSNLTISPYDLFLKKDRETFKARENKGASYFFNFNNKNILSLYDEKEEHVLFLPYHLDEISLTPEINVGDILIMKGDLFHKTQQTKSLRVAISICAFDENQILTKANYDNGGPFKKKYLEENLHIKKKLDSLFANNMTATIKDYIEL